MSKRARKTARPAESSVLAAPVGLFAQRSRFGLWLAFGFTLALTLAAYAHVFRAQFVFDGVGEIAENHAIRQLWPPGEAMFHGGTLPHRPLPYYSFAVNYAISGDNTWSYAAFNLAVHLASGALIFGIVRRSLASARLAGRYAAHADALAWAVATLWLVHPLTTQAVSYIYQRMESMMALCYLATVYGFIRGVAQSSPKEIDDHCDDASSAGVARAAAAEGRGPTLRAVIWLTASCIACALGTTCKEVIVTAPVLVLWYDYVFVAPSLRAILQRRWLYYLGLAASWPLLYLAVHSQSQAYGEISQPLWSRTEYFLNQAPVLLFYLRISVWPQGLCADHFWMPTHDAAVLAPALIAVAAMLVGVVLAMRWRPAWGFLTGAWFLILAPTSSVVPVTDLAVEHRLYLPLVLVIAGVAIAGFSLARSALTSSNASLSVWKACVIAAAIALAAVTYQRNEVYSSAEAFLEDVLAKSPLNARAWRVSVRYAGQNGRQAETLAQCQSAMRSFPQNPRAHMILGETCLEFGLVGDALKELETAESLAPDSDEVSYDLGMVYRKLGRNAEAAERFRHAIDIWPGFALAHQGLGRILLLSHDYAGAEAHLRLAARLLPETHAPHDLGFVLCKLDRFGEAADVLRGYVARHPDVAAGHENLGWALTMLGKWNEAEPQLRVAGQIDPQSVFTHVLLARCLVATGRDAEALREAHAALALEPKNGEALELRNQLEAKVPAARN